MTYVFKAVPPCLCGELLKVEPHPELKLARVGGRGEAERLCRRGAASATRARRGQLPELVQRQAADDVVDAREVRPVEEVEALERQLKELVLVEVEAAREPRVEAVEGLAQARVAAEGERAVGLRAAVVVGVEAEQEVERAARARDEDRREDPVAEDFVHGGVAVEGA